MVLNKICLFQMWKATEVWNGCTGKIFTTVVTRKYIVMFKWAVGQEYFLSWSKFCVAFSFFLYCDNTTICKTESLILRFWVFRLALKTIKSGRKRLLKEMLINSALYNICVLFFSRPMLRALVIRNLLNLLKKSDHSQKRRRNSNLKCKGAARCFLKFCKNHLQHFLTLSFLNLIFA